VGAQLGDILNWFQFSKILANYFLFCFVFVFLTGPLI